MAAPDAPEKPILVQAIQLGTYPEPNSTRAVLRELGEQFTIKSRKDLAPWMFEVKNGVTAPELNLNPNVPQTTAPNRPISGDFPIPPAVV